MPKYEKGGDEASSSVESGSKTGGKNRYNQARFLLGAPKPSSFPPDEGDEVAFAGRSNAGKSSALNALTGHRALARTSKAPGRTREINFFTLEDGGCLVDLPGYGYAKVSGNMREQWAKTIDHYLENRRSLRGVVLLMDIRHPFTEFDRQLIAWAEASDMPIHLLLTKSDKLGRGRAKAALLEARNRLGSHGGLVTVQLFSSLKRIGIDELRCRLDEWLGEPGAGKKGPGLRSGGRE